MSKTVKIWLIVAASLILVGAVIFVCAMTALDWRLEEVSVFEYETCQFEINDSYKNIVISVAMTDVELVATDEAVCRVECRDIKNIEYSAEVVNDTLVIKSTDKRRWYERIGFGVMNGQGVTVYMPKGEYGNIEITSNTGGQKIPADFAFDSIALSANTGNISCFASAAADIKIKTGTGDIRLEDISARLVGLTVTTGRTHIKNVSCESFSSDGSTGIFEANGLISAESITVNRGTGDVKLNASDAPKITVETGTGNVSGSLLTNKNFMVDTNTGRITVPQTFSEQECRVTTTTGDIHFTIE